MSTEATASIRKRVPRCGTPFLQTVGKIWPAVTDSAPRLSASTASSTECTETPTLRKRSTRDGSSLISSMDIWISSTPNAIATSGLWLMTGMTHLSLQIRTNSSAVSA